MTNYARFSNKNKIAYGIVEGEQITEISNSPLEAYSVLKETHKLNDVKLLSPVEPSKIISEVFHELKAPEVYVLDHLYCRGHSL